HFVGELALDRFDMNQATDRDLVDVVQRLAVGRAVSSDRDIAGLARIRGPVDMAHPAFELWIVVAFDDRSGDTDIGNLDFGDGITDGGQPVGKGLDRGAVRSRGIAIRIVGLVPVWPIVTG